MCIRCLRMGLTEAGVKGISIFGLEPVWWLGDRLLTRVM